MGYKGGKGQDPSRFTEAAEGRSELQYGDPISFLLLPQLDPPTHEEAGNIWK